MDPLTSFLLLPSFLFGVVGAWIVSKFAPKFGFVDHPNERSSHMLSTPKGGGIGILTAFVFAALFLEIPLAFWLPATFLALLSFLGDKFKISPKFRLLVQFIAALVLLFPILFSDSASASAFCLLPSALCFFLLSVFIVGTANFYNFMDGINGIAGITGVIGFGLLGFYAHLLEPGSSFTILAICISVSCLGFLPFNVPKARVFMGDVGSILLGFVFAGMAIWLSRSFLNLICLAAFLLPFYADELTTMIVRLRDKENLLRPHRRHLYQLLANEQGIPHWKIAVGYGLFQLTVGMSALILKPFGNIIVLLLIVVYFGTFIVVSSGIRRKVNVRV